MAFTSSVSAVILGIVCVVLVHRAPAANMNEDKNLRRLEQQNSASTTAEERTRRQQEDQDGEQETKVGWNVTMKKRQRQWTTPKINSRDTGGAAINALHNLFLEEDRLLHYLGTADNGDYEPLVQKRRSVFRRRCRKRGGSCVVRRNDCCESLACRCNFWGTNCHCQLASFLQRLG
ncbi:hypothetical protein BIW11_12991 [Tropilaelaps mercedesae]|uniref:U8-agatoxin-Ao1a-like n=1 Tax=Tropilaelaps mercedesae TaxID=418985 RepID=A0A1V9X3V2_9ACAR|nr:hypothetical protein BIW11_12991 [Tropilaelaps mercedesae]